MTVGRGQHAFIRGFISLLHIARHVGHGHYKPQEQSLREK